MIALNNPGYTIPAWHGVLLTVGAVLLTIIFNTVLLRKLPTFEGGMLVIHVFAFLAVFIILWVMGDKASGAQVFTEFSDPQGWGSVSGTHILRQDDWLTKTRIVRCSHSYWDSSSIWFFVRQ